MPTSKLPRSNLLRPLNEPRRAILTSLLLRIHIREVVNHRVHLGFGQVEILGCLRVAREVEGTQLVAVTSCSTRERDRLLTSKKIEEAR